MPASIPQGQDSQRTHSRRYTGDPVNCVLLIFAVVDRGAGSPDKLLVVALAEQEDESVYVVLQLVDAVGVVADEGCEAGGESRPLVAGDPVGEHGEHLGELDCVDGFEVDLGHDQSPSVSVSARWMSPWNSSARSVCPRSRAWSRCRVRMGRNCGPVRK